MSSRPVPRVGFSFEYLMWIFTRISGLALILLAIVGVAGAFLMQARTQMDMGSLLRWGYFPNEYHLQSTDILDVEAGYSGFLFDLYWVNPVWKVMQILIVFFGVTHGVNGLRVVIEDYVTASWLQILLRGLLFLFWLFILIVAANIVYNA
jgi:succinate dehydrogenase hydrophobic anchor subunit